MAASMLTSSLEGRKNTRCLVYSGTSRHTPNVPSLTSLAENIVTPNLRFFRFLSDRYFPCLQPLLAKLSAAQLNQFLVANPKLAPFCDSFYKFHCVTFSLLGGRQPSLEMVRTQLEKTKFFQAHPNLFQNRPLNSWSMAFELLDAEREYRLKQLSNSISHKSKTVKQKERKTLLIDVSHHSNRSKANHFGNQTVKQTLNKSVRDANVPRPSLASNPIKRPVKPPLACKPKKVAPLMRKCLNMKKSSFNR